MLKSVGTFRGHETIAVEIISTLKLNGKDGYQIQKYIKNSEGEREKEAPIFFSDQFMTHEKFLICGLKMLNENEF